MQLQLLLDFLSEHSAHMMNHPEEAILPDDGRVLPKLQGIIHADPSEMTLIAHELTDRDVCEWLPLRQVAEYRGQRVIRCRKTIFNRGRQTGVKAYNESGG